MYSEKRKEKRFMVFWRIFLNKNNLGYLVDISNSGLRFWVKEDDIPDSFAVSIQHPEKPENEKVCFEVNKIWLKKLECNHFYEIGCRLVNVNDDQQDSLTEFIDYFTRKKVHTTQIDFSPVG